MRNVLIIDDSLTVRMDLDEAFQAAGWETTLCPSAAAAREALGQCSFDSIILDVLLPDGNGLDLLKELRSNTATAGIPILLLSREAEVSEKIKGLGAGADDYVGKPYDRRHLISQAERLARQTESQSSEDIPPAGTILVIEDSPTFAASLQQALEQAGYAAALARTGQEGLLAAAQRPPKAVVIDAMLPDMDGLTVAQTIKADTDLRQIPCLLLTGSMSTKEDELRFLDAGADAFARKDEGLAVVLARLRAMLRPSEGMADSLALDDSLNGPKTILAVDDSPTYLHALAFYLRKDNYNVVVAESGNDALDLLQVRRVDCILLDLMMPGMSGQEICRHIKASPAWRSIPVVMLTGNEESESMIESFNSGADDYVSKSSDIAILRARLRAQLRRRQFEDEAQRIREELHKKECEMAQQRAAEQAMRESEAKAKAELERYARELEQRVAERTAKLEEMVGELEHFSYTITHDMRAPLRAMQGFGQLLLSECADCLNPSRKDLLRRIADSAGRMDNLITDSLNYSKVVRQELDLELVHPKPLLESMVESYPQFQPPKAEIRIEGDIPPVLGNEAGLTQCFSNFLNNAVKFVPPGKVPQVRVWAETRGEYVRLWFEDNGIGIARHHQEQIFVMFQRLSKSYEGTGIGLALVRKVVERMKGKAGVESEPGQGSRFWLELKRGS